MQLDRGNRENEQAKPDVAEQPLDPLERQEPRDDDESDHREDDQVAIRQTRKQLEHDRNASDLGGAGHQIHH